MTQHNYQENTERANRPGLPLLQAIRPTPYTLVP